MSIFEAFVVILGAVVLSISMYFAGFTVGGNTSKSIIVEECAKYNVYTDRRLLMRCEVMRPSDDVSRTS